MAKDEHKQWVQKNLGVKHPTLSKGGGASGGKDAQYGGIVGKDEQYGGVGAKDRHRPGHDVTTSELLDSTFSYNEGPEPTGHEITASVGNGGRNKRADVLKVQNRLNVLFYEGFSLDGFRESLNIDGTCGRATIAAIKAFQTSLGFRPIDGLVEPGKRTAKALFNSPRPLPAPLPVSDPSNATSQSDDTGEAGVSEVVEAADVVREQQLRETLSLVADGSHGLLELPELLEILHIGGWLGTALPIVAEFAAPVVTLAIMGYSIYDAGNESEKILNAQGYCYGIMYEVNNLNSVDRTLSQGELPLTDDEKEAWP